MGELWRDRTTPKREYDYRVCVNWTAVAALATSLYTVAFIFSVWVLRHQLIALRIANYSQAFAAASSMLRDPLVMRAREVVRRAARDPEAGRFNGNVTGLDGTGVIAKRDMAELVCHVYDDLAVMVREEMLPVRLARSAWSAEARRLWESVKEFVAAERTSAKDPDLWKQFEKFATNQ
jgi:hypothetical protein